MNRKKYQAYFDIHEFYVGQRVVCVDDRFNPERLMCIISNGMTIPVEGEVYTIRELVAQPKGNGILLHEIVNACRFFGPEFCEPLFYAYRFRPLNEMEAMLEAEKVMEEALVG